MALEGINFRRDERRGRRPSKFDHNKRERERERERELLGEKHWNKRWENMAISTHDKGKHVEKREK